MPTLLVNGIHYTYKTSGVHPPLLLLHGFAGSSESWNGIIERVKEQFRVIAPDLIGHGRSDAPADPKRYSIEYAARDLAALIVALNAYPTHILGYSMGGRIALQLALTHPEIVRSLILESASPGIADDKSRQERFNHDHDLAEQIERNGIEWFVDYWENLPLFASHRHLEDNLQGAQRRIRMANHPHGLANSLRGGGAGAQKPLWDRLAQLTCPTLIIAGELDHKYSAVGLEMQRLIPNAALEIIHDCGHTPHLEKSNEFGDIALKFLESK